MPQSDDDSAEINDQLDRYCLNDLVTDGKEAKFFDIITLETRPLSEFTLYLYSEAVMSAEEEKCAWKIHASTQPLFNMQIPIGDPNTLYHSINIESNFFRKLKCFDAEGVLQIGQKLVGENGEAAQFFVGDLAEFECDKALDKHSIYTKIKRITAVDNITSLQEFWRKHSVNDSAIMQDPHKDLDYDAIRQAASEDAYGDVLVHSLTLAAKEDHAPQTIFDSIMLQLFRDKNFDLLMKIGSLVKNGRKYRDEARQLMVYFFIKIIKLEKLEQVLQLGMSEAEKGNDENLLNKVFLKIMSKPLVNTQLMGQYAGELLCGHHLVYHLHLKCEYRAYADLILKAGWLVERVVDAKLVAMGDTAMQSLSDLIQARDDGPCLEYATSSDCSDDESDDEDEQDAAQSTDTDAAIDEINCWLWSRGNRGVSAGTQDRRACRCVIA